MGDRASHHSGDDQAFDCSLGKPSPIRIRSTTGTPSSPVDLTSEAYARSPLGPASSTCGGTRRTIRRVKGKRYNSDG